jgi:hypothetical protein
MGMPDAGRVAVGSLLFALGAVPGYASAVGHDRSHLVPIWDSKCSKNRRDGGI